MLIPEKYKLLIAGIKGHNMFILQYVNNLFVKKYVYATIYNVRAGLSSCNDIVTHFTLLVASAFHKLPGVEFFILHHRADTMFTSCESNMRQRLKLNDAL